MRDRTPEAIAKAREFRKQSSFSEDRLWQNLRNHRIGYSFRRNHPMLNTWWLDFYCPEAKLCIEVDGEQHEETRERDEYRDAQCATEGILTVRFSSQRVLNEMSEVLLEIQKLCEQRTGRPPRFRVRK